MTKTTEDYLEYIFLVFSNPRRSMQKEEVERFSSALRYVRDDDPILYALEVEPELLKFIHARAENKK